MYYYFLYPGKTGIMYYLNNHMYYLPDISELIKVYLSIEHQSSETNPWKWQIPMKAQIC